MLEKKFEPQLIESKWYQYWEKNDYFSPQTNQDNSEAYCIMLPPPNVTGSLHMGHAFQDTIMDTLIRYQRMQGKKTLWQGGTDHAGIATQMVVERQLLSEGKNRHDLGREKFVNAIWQWKNHSGDRITQQLRQLGCSIDWENERFTLDEDLSQAVKKVFIELYDEDLIYKGKRLSNWDPILLTALSDLEVINEERQGNLWHIRYPIVDSNDHLIIATTRPETMLGDTAIAINPDDDRYQHLIGKKAFLPLTERKIPIIADDYVDPKFGTGCVKITPAHDFNDYEVGKRHQLEFINILTAEAKINENAPKQYQELDCFEARKKIIADLSQLGLLEKTEPHTLMVPIGDRSGAIIEPLLTDQWFVKIDSLANPAIEAVKNGNIKFIPEQWNKTFFEWMNNIQDWCISRQLWWGHQIPAWYDDENNVYVGYDEKHVREKYNLTSSLKLTQDSDVLDTWFSSALWPFSTLGWPKETERLKTFYPTNVLVTGFDIIFFWVARMIMLGLKFKKQIPFKEVYIHGLIKDAYGQKMSKSKGNVIDPIDLVQGIDLDSLIKKRTSGLMQPDKAPSIIKKTKEEFPDGIKAYGTDALRFTYAALATHARDITFETGKIESYRNFCNKLWNAARFVLMNTESFIKNTTIEEKPTLVVDCWIQHQLNQLCKEVNHQLSQYRLDLAAKAMYEFIWHDYCDWYLELSKSSLQSANNSYTQYSLLFVLEKSLRIIHPIMPFISEELWQKLAPKLHINAPTISLQSYPNYNEALDDLNAAEQITWLKAILTGIRQIRGEMDIPPGKELSILLAKGTHADREKLNILENYIRDLGKISNITWIDNTEEKQQCAVAIVDKLEILIPLSTIIDPKEEIERLSKLIAKEEKQKIISEKKLANENFTQKAPENVVVEEKNRLEKHLTTIEKLKQQVEKIKKI